MKRTLKWIESRVRELDRDGDRGVIPLYFSLETAMRAVPALPRSAYRLTFFLLDNLVYDVLLDGGKVEDDENLVYHITHALSSAYHKLVALFENDGWKDETAVVSILIEILRNSEGIDDICEAWYWGEASDE